MEHYAKACWRRWYAAFRITRRHKANYIISWPEYWQLKKQDLAFYRGSGRGKN
ncbi:MAG: hypothetical protein KME28_13985 [Pelatocladus maniniholoensis HA4357-MV3]|uniref:Uncharacterized protein n=1 Tax=Pelatocladus maniniholoensis HA4357-MV3 TaxID=1117104 RepID=A0A9E3H889_9NOST|nr:hypothetical protein [Pelatocladus maniniholoensis HA4357-MV3]